MNMIEAHVKCSDTISDNAQYYNSLLMMNVIINIFNDFRDILHIITKEDETHAFLHFIKNIFIMSSINIGEAPVMLMKMVF